MKLTYDPRHNIAYLRFQEKTSEVETIQLSDVLNVDFSHPTARFLALSSCTRTSNCAVTTADTCSS